MRSAVQNTNPQIKGVEILIKARSRPTSEKPATDVSIYGLEVCVLDLIQPEN